MGWARRLSWIALTVIWAALPAVAQEAAGGLPPGGSFGAAAARSFGALALVLACVVALSYGARHLLRRAAGGVGGRQAIEIVASRSLGGRCSLTLVEVAGERILVGSTPQSLNLICKVGRGARPGDCDRHCDDPHHSFAEVLDLQAVAGSGDGHG
ncbi:MAG TPA: flagellar biosynthetic protein FliO [bacterium]|jgi:flagellar biosynthetic protein FliO